MKTWHFYDSQTGEPTHRSYAGPERHLEENTPPGCEAREDAPPAAVEQPVDAQAMTRRILLARIHAIEATQDRALREERLGYDGAKQRLQDIDDQIVALRAQLVAIGSSSGSSDKDSSAS